jgi:predicted nucleotidyltransferase component of viral defense system
MHEAIGRMLAGYGTNNTSDSIRALREILQEVALLGLWRAKFFEHAAFYGGTALRIMYGLDRFSEDMDFSLLEPDSDFDISRFLSPLEDELRGFGFNIKAEKIEKTAESAVQSAFLKTNTRTELLVIETTDEIVKSVPAGSLLKIKLEVDTDPPAGFSTETRFLLRPIPFSVRCYTLPCLFAGKMHALFFRRWKNRVKGRDWYDLIWYVTNFPELNLHHLEQRMRQTGHWSGNQPFTQADFRELVYATVERLDINQARRDVMPFVKDPSVLIIWSHEFFYDVVGRIKFI